MFGRFKLAQKIRKYAALYVLVHWPHRHISPRRAREVRYFAVRAACSSARSAWPCAARRAAPSRTSASAFPGEQPRKKNTVEKARHIYLQKGSSAGGHLHWQQTGLIIMHEFSAAVSNPGKMSAYLDPIDTEYRAFLPKLPRLRCCVFLGP